jgi:hypothetical protein
MDLLLNMTSLPPSILLKEQAAYHRLFANQSSELRPAPAEETTGL